MRYVAVDPGDRWVGVVVMDHHAIDRLVTWPAVFDIRESSMVDVAKLITNELRVDDDVQLIIESFQHRPLGHQSFNAGLTSRLIGALEFGASMLDAALYFIPPGSPDEAEKLFGSFIEHYSKQFAEHPQWRHALSAWRVLGLHLVMKNLRLLKQCRRARITGLTPDHADNELIGATLRWALPVGRAGRSG